jgi:hypothetical protein
MKPASSGTSKIYVLLASEPPYDATLPLDLGSDWTLQVQAPCSDSSCLIWLPLSPAAAGAPSVPGGRPTHSRTGGSWFVGLPIQRPWCRADGRNTPADIICPVHSKLPAMLNGLSTAGVLATQNVRPYVCSHLRSPEASCLPSAYPAFPDATPTAVLTPSASSSPMSASIAFQHQSQN